MSEPKRRGRPPKHPEGRKATTFTFRTRANLRELIEAAAAESGRSATEEVELRLIASFAEDRMRAIARDEVARCWEMTSLAVAEEERAARQHEVAAVEQVINGRH